MKKTLIACGMVTWLAGLAAWPAAIQGNENFPNADVILSQREFTTRAQMRYTPVPMAHSSLGQSFVLDQPASVKAITLQKADNITFDDESHVLELWIGEYDSTTGTNHVMGTTLHREQFSLSGETFIDGNFYTFNLASNVNLSADVEYAFELDWKAEDAWHIFNLKRYEGTESGIYTNGTVVFSSPVTEFPYASDLNTPENDLVFALHSDSVGAYSEAPIRLTGGYFPLNDLVASQSTGSVSGGRVAKTSSVIQSAGQTFTIEEETTLSMLTVQSAVDKTFDTAGEHTMWLWIGDWSGGTPGSTHVFTHVDLAGMTLTTGQYYRIDFDETVLPAGTYAFQLGWKMESADHDIVLMSNDADLYPGGERLVDNTSSTLPFAGGDVSTDDLVFALHSAADAVLSGTGTTFPDSGVLAGNAADGAIVQMRADSVTHQTFGQTFTLATETLLDAITLKAGGNYSFAAGKNEVEIWIGPFTAPSSMGATYLLNKLDFSNITLTDGNFYRIDLTDVVLPAGKYAMEMQWTSAADKHAVNWCRGTNSTYAGGDRLFKNDADNLFSVPFDSVEQSGQDLVFALQGTGQSTLSVDPSVLSIRQHSPSGSSTGTVSAVFLANGNMEADISISDETHAGAFSVLSVTPQVLTNSAGTPLSFKFDNSIAGLGHGETATGRVTVVWNDAGGTNGVFEFPIQAVVDTNTYASATVTTEFPVDNVVIGQSLKEASWWFRRVSSITQEVGQAFTLTEETILSDLTVLVTGNINAGNPANNLVQLWIGTYSGSTPGATYVDELVDMTGVPVNANQYLTIDFSDTVFPAGTYAFQLGWQEMDDSHTGTFGRSTTDQYGGGGALYILNAAMPFPVSVAQQSYDLVFALREASASPAAALSSTGYDVWISGYGLAGESAVTGADVEPDGLNNLQEYAFGGNPTNADFAAVAPASYMMEVGGVNWMYYIHNERMDDPSLVYTLGTQTSLVAAPVWDDADVYWVGETAVFEGIKSVTNRTELNAPSKFIKLKVEKK